MFTNQNSDVFRAAEKAEEAYDKAEEAEEAEKAEKVDEKADEKAEPLDNLIGFLYSISDNIYKQRLSLKQLHQDYPNQLELVRVLTRRSMDPVIRNLGRPIGERYVPVYYDSDCYLKINIKRYGLIPTLTIWDLLILDIDTTAYDSYDSIKSKIESQYPNELFYIHKTPRGYHLYLMSKSVKYCSKQAISYRINLGCDPSYGVFSLYNGSSIRLAKKKGDTEKPSIKIGEIGSGKPDSNALKLYEKCTKFIEMFQNEDSGEFSQDGMKKLWDLWNETVNNNDNFGLIHVAVTAPMLLYNNNDKIQINYLIDSSEELQKAWKEFQTTLRITPDNLDILLKASKCIKQYNNLYRIYKATDDYAIGTHTQESLNFISYRDLLVIDYDNNDDIKNIYEFQKIHPEYVFRVVKTHRGYHVFCTSNGYEHDSIEAIKLQLKLNSDHCYILSCYHRGYSVRTNRKYVNENEYNEINIIGTGKEDPRLLELYQMHLSLYRENRDCEPYLCMTKYTEEYFKQFLHKNNLYF